MDNRQTQYEFMLQYILWAEPQALGPLELLGP